jgi:hypothetical protein
MGPTYYISFKDIKETENCYYFIILSSTMYKVTIPLIINLKCFVTEDMTVR